MGQGANLFQPYLDKLIGFVSEAEFQPELQRARKAYFEQTGEVFETDDAFEMRMASFLEWFIFDRRLVGTQATPAELFVERMGAQLTEQERIVYRNFSHTIHGLFEVGKLKPDTMVMKDLF